MLTFPPTLNLILENECIFHFLLVPGSQKLDLAGFWKDASGYLAVPGLDIMLTIHVPGHSLARTSTKASRTSYSQTNGRQ